MIKSEMDTAQPADERWTDKDGTQSGRIQARAEHDEHAQKGATRVQRAARRERQKTKV